MYGSLSIPDVPLVSDVLERDAPGNVRGRLLLGTVGAAALHIIDDFSDRVHVVVSLCQECPARASALAEVMHLPLRDDELQPVLGRLDEVADFIHERISSGKTVLLHCVCGISRSPTFAIAYVMKYADSGRDARGSYDRACEFVRARRPCIDPNPGFRAQLVEYEEMLVARAKAVAGHTASTRTSA